MPKIVFLNGKFVEQDSLENLTESQEINSMPSNTDDSLNRRTSDHESERDTLTLDVLASLQNDLNNITLEKEKAVALLNNFRLAIFPKDEFESLKR